jgi:2-polyprenyl-3-methyl-5-hydroxy-6-metoxy-1,4-benzoquinol methylase
MLKINFENSSCGFCDSDASISLYPAPRKSLYSQCQIVQCSSCGLVRTNPRPTQSSLSEVYSDEYYSRKAPTSEGLGSKIKSFAMKHKLTYLYPYVIPFSVSKNAAICDVGCGSGQWLSHMRMAYPDSDLYGFEIDEATAVIAAKSANANVHSGDFLKNNWNSGSFDFIVFWDVLEHVENPKKIMDEVSRLLKPNGIVVVISPDFECFYSKTFKQFWWALLFDQHLYHFSRKTLAQIFSSSQLELVLSSTPNTFPHAHWNIDNVLQDLELDGFQKTWKYSRLLMMLKMIAPLGKIQLTRILPQHLMMCAKKTV